VILTQDPLVIVGVLVALVVGITFHEFSHAFVADLLGDRRPRALGRVSLNPLRHIEPIGALMFVLAGFGWGRPVPVNVYALRQGERSMALVSAAGPLANAVVATTVAIPLRLLLAADVDASPVTAVLFSVVYLNFVLAFFNLVPVPPLDGYRFALTFLAPRYVYRVQRYEQYGLLILIALVLLSAADSPVNPLGFVFDIALWLTRAILAL
jgi:Zn-dependent protease